MSEMRAEPGRFESVEILQELPNGEDRHIATFFHPNTRGGDQVAPENAKLFMAAPKLLEELKDAVHFYDEALKMMGAEDIGGPRVARWMSAIAEATP